MSFTTTTWAWSEIRTRALPFRARLILLALADRHNGDSGLCFPSIARLAHDTGLHKETVMQSIKVLESEGIIKVERKLGAGSSYSFPGLNTDQSADTDQSANTDQSVNTDADQSVFTDHHQSVNTDTNQEIQSVIKPISPSATKTPSVPITFDQFYAAYPKKKGKQDAERAWNKLKPNSELAIEIIHSLERATKSQDWLKDEGQFIPYPATWLNGRRWEDEVGQIADSQRPLKGDNFLGIGGVI